jgi:hypothetical protein
LDHIVAVAILREEGEVWREGKWEEGNRGVTKTVSTSGRRGDEEKTGEEECRNRGKQG